MSNVRRIRVGGRNGNNRSKITNGKRLFPVGTDARTAWHRRFKDLIGIFTDDLGGSDSLSEGKKGLIRRAATLSVQLELMEASFADAEGDVIPDQLDLFSRLSKSLRLLLKELGLEKRKDKDDITPLDYMRRHHHEDDDDE